VSIELQLALDVLDKDRAVRVASDVADIVDRIEVGTPFLLRYGIRAIAAIRNALPSAFIVADCKIMDCGRVVAERAFEAGADSVIVQAGAARATLEAVCDTASRMNRQVMVDGLGIYDVRALASKIHGFPFSHVVIHSGLDEQKVDSTLPVRAVEEARRTAGLPPIAVAGGISPSNIRDLLPLTGIQLIIVGAAISNSATPRSVATELFALAGIYDTSGSSTGARITDAG
jgi:3-hexulose-6-phosphate synthase